MKIKYETGLLLLHCLEQINDHYRREILVFDGKQKFKGFSLLLDASNDFYITTSHHNKHIVSNRINTFMEDVYCLLKDAKIIDYQPVDLSDGSSVRFDGFQFIEYNRETREHSFIPFGEFDQKKREEYFESILQSSEWGFDFLL